MSPELLKRRIKRSLLDFVARRGYDLEKAPGLFPPYRLVRRLDLGEDPFADAARISPGTVRCVFDVGAHVGQTAVRLLDAFPQAAVYCFEPDARSFAELRRLAADCARITPVNAALGDAEGDATLFLNKFDQTNSLLPTAPGASRYLVRVDGMERQAQRTVSVTTLDRFCAERGIERVDLLKLDTQGYELRVLEGARGLIGRLSIPLIYLELNFVQYYEEQPLFPEVYNYLYEHGYRLVWLYDRSFYTHFYSVGANGLFVHESIATRSSPTAGGARSGGAPPSR